MFDSAQAVMVIGAIAAFATTVLTHFGASEALKKRVVTILAALGAVVVHVIAYATENGIPIWSAKALYNVAFALAAAYIAQSGIALPFSLGRFTAPTKGLGAPKE